MSGFGLQTSGTHLLQVLTGSAFFQVSEQINKAPLPSMGEMTTTDTSNRPSSEESKHVLPKKPGLTEGACVTDTGPREASQAQLTPPPLPADKGSITQEGFPGKAETSGNKGNKAGPDEPMDMETCLWRKPSTTTDSQANQAETEASPSGLEAQQKVTEISRTPELSLEELSISSRQLQPQVAAPKVTVATGVTDQASLRKPNRKRKLIEDVESGKTLLLDAYRVWQQGQKIMTYDLGRIEKIMSETYMLIKQVNLSKIFHGAQLCCVRMNNITTVSLCTTIMFLFLLSHSF